MPSAGDKFFIYSAPVVRICVRYEASPFLLRRIEFLEDDGSGEVLSATGYAAPPAAADRIVSWLDSYFSKRPRPLPWELLKTETFTPLQRAVWAAAARIGFGASATYGQLAKAIGRPGAARFVGSTLGKNPFPIMIPCHRIIRSDGGLGGFSGGISIKKKLMAFEAF